MPLFILLLILVISSSAAAQDYVGDISGKVVDSKTLEGIPNVHVIVTTIPGIGTASDIAGSFHLKRLAVGTYSLSVSAVGYTPQVVTNVVIATGRATPVMVKLEETAIEMEGVTAEADYFSRAQAMSPVSANVFERSEILRLPGSIQDVQRVVQNLPGVASSNDNVNELIVRGGAPDENLTILDGMEIPSINHYPNQFNSAGPINMVNADMVEEVKVQTSNYGAESVKGPVVISAIGKSGAADYHGQVYLHGRDSKFNSTEYFFKKWAARRGMSSFRSLNGGSLTWMTLRR